MNTTSNEATTGRKAHKHAALIKAWADGAVIQTATSTGNWVDVSRNIPSWREDCQYRIKPEPVYPKSTLTYAELNAVVGQATATSKNTFEGTQTIIARYAADAAVKKYIQETTA